MEPAPFFAAVKISALKMSPYRFYPKKVALKNL